MLTLEPCPVGFLRVRASGRLTAADYHHFEPDFAAELKRRKRHAQPVRGTGEHATPIPLLLDMRGFRGWTPGGFLRDLAWDLRNRRTFSRIAVIGDKNWHRWITAAGRPLFGAPMNFFRPDEERYAEDWLAGRS
jgi:hypothetical protein